MNRIRKDQRRWILGLLLISSTCAFSAAHLDAQVFRRGGIAIVADVPYCSPATALTAQIRAQADLLRATGAASVNLATARSIQADTYRKELENRVELVRANWERRAIGEAERMKRYVGVLDRQKLRNSKTWERLKNHPELIGAGIISGRGLNFLLQRLSGTVLAYEFSLGAAEHDPELLNQLALTPEILHGLHLRQNGFGGEHYVFRAGEGKALQADWWPVEIREERYQSDRGQFEKSRQRVLAAASGKLSTADFPHNEVAEMEQALRVLSRAFDRRNSKAHRLRDGMRTWRNYKRAELFLKSLDGEIQRLKQSQDARALSGGLRFDVYQHGNDLIALLKFMNRNGLDFAPAQQPTDEPAYHQVFRMMRDLFITVAQEDEGIQAVKNSGRSSSSTSDVE